MAETCNFCKQAIEEITKNIDFESEADRDALLAETILAYGKLFGCGEDRLTCYPLIKVTNGLDEDNT